MKLLLLAVFIPSVALAAFELNWQLPADCAAHPATAELVGEAEGKAEVQLRAEGEGWLVTVLFFEPAPGVRRVSAPSCEQAVRAASLLVKLGSRGATTPPPPRVETAPPPPEPKTEVPRWSLSVAAGTAFDIATAPTVEPRVVLSGVATRGPLLLALDARFGVSSRPIETLRVTRAFELQASAGLMAKAGAFTGGPAVTLAGGTWNAKTINGVQATTVLLAAGPAVRGSVVFGPGIELGALAGLRFNLTRPAPVVDGTVVFTTPVMSGDLQLTLGWRW